MTSRQNSVPQKSYRSSSPWWRLYCQMISMPSRISSTGEKRIRLKRSNGLKKKTSRMMPTRIKVTPIVRVPMRRVGRLGGWYGLGVGPLFDLLFCSLF